MYVGIIHNTHRLLLDVQSVYRNTQAIAYVFALNCNTHFHVARGAPRSHVRRNAHVRLYSRKPT